MKTLYLFFEDEKIRIPLFDYDKSLFTELVKSGMGHWEQSEKRYNISRSSYNQKQIKTIAAGRPFIEVGKEAENTVTVHGFISGDETEPETSTETVLEKVPINEINHDFRITALEGNLPDQFPEYWKKKMEIEMHTRNYSPKTKSSYLNYNIELCKWLQKKPEDVITFDIKRYLAYLEHTKRQAAATINYNISAFKFFYRYVVNKDVVNEQKRPRQDKRLPVVLSKYEVKKMFDCIRNPKHRILLMMVYASGLRVGEVVNLRKEHIDFIRKTIFVKRGKGRKDRYTLMSQTIKEELSFYIEQYNITDWLFPGAYPNSHLSIRTAQYIFKQALKNAGIEKRASIHCLRHTFATHLLEGGTDITYIRDLLGHNSLRTTEVYTHVAKKKMLNIISPLDTINIIDDED